MPRRLGALALFGLVLTLAAQARPTLVILTSGSYHPMTWICQRILPEAYDRLGYDVEFRDVPPNRADAEFNNGEADGFIFSDDLFATSHPGALKVDALLGRDDLVVFTRGPAPPPGWEGLRPFTVGYLKGMWVVEQALIGFHGDVSHTPPAVIQKLSLGRIDYAVLPWALGTVLIREQHAAGIRAVGPPLARVGLFHFLTAKNAALAPGLTRELLRMERSGRLAQVTAETYSTLGR